MTQANAAATPARTMNILIVDDSATMRAVLQRIIRLTGIEVERIFEARNGREALKILEAESVQALFTDINMPVMTGHELLRAMAKEERWKDILRVVISTDGSKLRRDEARELNVSLYVEKPFRPEVVRDVLVQITSPA